VHGFVAKIVGIPHSYAKYLYFIKLYYNIVVILKVCGRLESNGPAPKDAQSTREGGRKSGDVEVLKARWTRGSSVNENPLFILNVEVFFLDLPKPFPLKSFESAFG
jgi:hypothetical protein